MEQLQCAHGAQANGSGTSGRGPEGTQQAAVTTMTSWNAPGDLGFEDWVHHGRRLGAIGRASSWWIGDWLRYGNARYGEKYSRATQVTGYDAKSLRNMVYVATSFELHRRRDGLSFSHHAALASMPHDAQDRWLDVTERERMSVRCLRLEVAQERRAGLRDGAAPPAHGPEGRWQAAEASAPAAASRVAATVVGAPPAAVTAGPEPGVCCPECGCQFRLDAAGDGELSHAA